MHIKKCLKLETVYFKENFENIWKAMFFFDKTIFGTHMEKFAYALTLEILY